MSCEGNPDLIQGGMAVGVANWRLAKAVALAGRNLNKSTLGVVAGTGVEVLLARRLQDGDPEGHVQRALAAFPYPRISESILNQYYFDVKKPPSARYKFTPRPADLLSGDPEKIARMNELSVAANFVEVWLAKEGHDRPIGINHLEKVQLLHLPRLYGAMLAGVDYVIEGAGIPDQVPGVLDRLSNLEIAQYNIDVTGSNGKLPVIFDPSRFGGKLLTQELRRPRLLAIISSNLLARVLATRVSGEVYGFVVEKPTAGGHNAPPRGKLILNEKGEPIYGDKDVVDLGKLAELKKPFWAAGGYASPAMFAEALAVGAAGIQTGTIFALCEESGMRADLKQEARRQAFDKVLENFTSVTASPTGFPFKVAQISGTVAERAVSEARVRACTAGHLVEVYQTKKGRPGFRCSAEPVKTYVQKGGEESDTVGVECICNELLATAGYAQTDKLGTDPPIVTLGDDTSFISEVLEDRDGSYTAEDAVRYLLGR